MNEVYTIVVSVVTLNETRMARKSDSPVVNSVVKTAKWVREYFLTNT